MPGRAARPRSLVRMEHTVLGDLISVWWIALAAMAAPLLASLTRKKVPDVVWLLVLGAVIGPDGLGLAVQTQGITLVREIGLGLLFLLAGLEIDPAAMRSRQGRSAATTWMLCLALGIGAGLMIVQGNPRAAIVLGIASTSTALGTLLPMMQDAGATGTRLGSATLVHGALGELGPIIAMALLLSSKATWASALVLIGFAIAAALLVALPVRLFRRIPALGGAIEAGVNTTMQTTMRLSMLILITLMTLSGLLDLDMTLGAFMAGMLIGRLMPHGDEEFVGKVQVLGFSFLIPVFFVTSGMAIDVGTVSTELGALAAFVVTILLVRGLPVFLREQFTDTGSGLTTVKERIALGLYASAGLPIIVAVTEIAVEAELLTEQQSSVMVAGGALTVLLFPLLAGVLTRDATPAERTPAEA